MFPSFAATDNASLLQDFTMQRGYSEISQNIANALMQERKDIVVIDVRTPEEFAQGHIEGAINIPVETMKDHEQLSAVPDTSTPVLLYCRTGRRATKAGQLMVKNGYQYVMNFGGVTTWQYGLTGSVR